MTIFALSPLVLETGAESGIVGLDELLVITMFDISNQIGNKRTWVQRLHSKHPFGVAVWVNGLKPIGPCELDMKLGTRAMNKSQVAPDRDLQ
jgi:hypothetical protein